MRANSGEREWAREEFGGLGVGDLRRRDRVLAMGARLAGSAAGRVSDVFDKAAERQGAYDLLEGGRVPAEAILEACAAASVRRSEGESFAVVPIDATSIQVVDRARRTDLGLVGTFTNDGRGLNVVTALSVSARGTPLGICAQTWWARPTTRRKRCPSSYRPVHERESRHMVQTIHDVARRYEGSGCTPWMVIDRGGDGTVVLDALLGSGARFTVRASWNRRIKGNRSYPLVRDRLAAAPIVMRYTVHVPAGYKRKERVAQLEVRVARVQLNVAHDWRARRADPIVNVLWITEIKAPPGEKSLDWMLYTNAPIDASEQIKMVVRSYTLRWRIEDFHKTWKSGHCGVEDTQLRTTAAVKTWATLLATVAARVERLKHLARNEPDLPASKEMSSLELEALVLLKTNQKKKTESIPDGVPPISLAVRWIADLGGYTGKSSGGPPGATTLARGLFKVETAVQLLQSLREREQKR